MEMSRKEKRNRNRNKPKIKCIGAKAGGDSTRVG
jgi:hypothetical protein